MIDRIVETWRRSGMGLNAGAALVDLAALERRLGVPLPSDVRLFFSLADGMPDGEVDEHLISFWPIQKILRNSPHAPGPQEGDLPIADVMIESWRICLRVTEGEVVVVTDPSSFELPSLSAFFERYLSDPDGLGLLNERGHPTRDETGPSGGRGRQES
jgi:hypothetical protein